MVEDLEEKITPVLEEYQEELPALFEQATDGFHDMSKQAITLLVDIIFKDLKDTFDKLFHKEWYEGNIIDSVKATLEDYFEDIVGHIGESHFRRLISIPSH